MVKEKPLLPPEVKPVVEKPAPIKVEVVQEQPKKPVEPPPLPEVPEPQPVVKFPVKRRTETTDEDLRKQLLLAKVVALDAVPRTSQTLIAAAQSPGNQGKDLVPMLARQRTDLFGLPLKMGHECHTGKEPAENLQVLSRKLRSHLAASLPPAANGQVVDPRPDPVLLRQRLLNDAQRDGWLLPEAIPTLLQMLMAENKRVRLVLVDVLAQIKGVEATRALARRAVVDLHPEVREAALVALQDRPRADYEGVFLAGFRYPWPALADHAAEGAVALGMRDLVPKLIPLLDLPDPGVPFRMTMTNKKTMIVAREVVRINHLSNCLLCHPSSFAATDLVRGRAPTPGQPLNGPTFTGYGGTQGNFVRADITYLKQDFSVCQPVLNSAPWPHQQRFDYLVRFRPVTPDALLAFQRKNQEAKPLYPQKEAVLFALRNSPARTAAKPPTTCAKSRCRNSPRCARARGSLEVEPGPGQSTGGAAAGIADPVPDGRGYGIHPGTGSGDSAVAERRAENEPGSVDGTPHSLGGCGVARTLHSENREIRVAAIHACGRAGVKPLVADLIEQLAAADKETNRRLRWALEQITGKDFGPAARPRRSNERTPSPSGRRGGKNTNPNKETPSKSYPI